MKPYTNLEQSKKLAEILPIESADMGYIPSEEDDDGNTLYTSEFKSEFIFDDDCCIHCWSLAALFNVLPEINGVNLKFERVKAEDGYDGYYYHIEYEGIILIPYSKNLVDACYEMILKLHEQKLL